LFQEVLYLEIAFAFQPGTFDLSQNEGSMTDRQKKNPQRCAHHPNTKVLLFLESCKA